MVGILEFFQAAPVGVTDSVRADPYSAHWVAGAPYKLHSMVGAALFFSSCLVFVREALGEHIHCIQDQDGSKITPAAFNSYCYISSTFTLPPEEIVDPSSSSIRIYSGVGVYSGHRLARDRSGDDVHYHNYYQWVAYLLFLQSLSFFLPLMLHRFFQDGRVQNILQGLHNLVLFQETREDKYGDIAIFFRDWYNRQNYWALKVVLVDVLNLLNVILNIFFVNWYLGGSFLTYGPVALAYLATDPEERDPEGPFDLVFPKMTKCTLNSFGPSGTIQTHDALCVMPVNVLNEKIYLLLWFALFSVAAFTVIHHIIAAVILSYRHLRKKYLMLYISPKRPNTRRKLSQLLDLTGFGDWMVLFQIARNTDRVVFGEVVDYVKFPDYDWDLEPLDRENRRLLEIREMQDWGSVSGSEKTRRLNSEEGH